MNVLVLVGSLRTDSLNRRLALAALEHLPAGVTGEVFEGLADLPHYSTELDVDPLPRVAADLRRAVATADALLVVTPEYNGSLPSALKNAIDWASRPRGGAAIAGVPTAVLAASGSPRGAQWAREDAARILRVAGAEVLDDTVGVGSAVTTLARGRVDDGALDAAVRALVHRLAAEGGVTSAA